MSPRTSPQVVAALLLATWLTTACFPGAPVPSPVSATAPPAPAESAKSSDTRPQEGSRSIYATLMRPGDCLNYDDGYLVVELVPCAEPHMAEFAGSYVLPDGAWPGESEVVRLADEGCDPEVLIKPSKEEQVGYLSLPPLESNWPRYRTAYCLAAAFEGLLEGNVLR